MPDILGFLDGKKTYLGVLAVALGVVGGLTKILTQEQAAYVIASGLGLMGFGLRHSDSKTQTAIAEVQQMVATVVKK